MTPPRLSADDRRAQIATAVLSVVLDHGLQVTSKQLAKAAGVAEGTLYKVFGDKETLLREVARRDARRADAVGEWMASGDASALGLEELVREIVDRSLAQYAQQFRIFQVLGPILAAPGADDIAQFERELQLWSTAFEPHASELAISPHQAASILRSLSIGAASESAWGTGMAGDDVVQVFLHGVGGSRDTVSSTPGPAATTTKKD